MKKYLHIGLGKAASTTLQAALFDNILEIDFIGRRGVEQTSRNLAINQITHLNSFQYSQESVVDKLAIDGNRKSLISDEMCSTFSRIDPYIIAGRLKSILGSAKVLLITREPEDWLNSLYFFRLTRGHQDVFQHHDAWLASNLRLQKIGSPLLQVFYAKLHDIYQTAFGLNSVTILPYELLKYDSKKFYNSIENFLDIKNGSIKVGNLKGKVFKKRFSMKHFELISLLFDLNKNKNLIDELIISRLDCHTLLNIPNKVDILSYRKFLVKEILKFPIVDQCAAKIEFDESLIREIYFFNSEIDRSVERFYGISLAEYGYKSFPK